MSGSVLITKTKLFPNQIVCKNLGCEHSWLPQKSCLEVRRQGSRQQWQIQDLKVTVAFAAMFVFIDHNLCIECGITLAFLLAKLVLRNWFIVEVQATVCVHLLHPPSDTPQIVSCCIVSWNLWVSPVRVCGHVTWNLYCPWILPIKHKKVKRRK